MVEPPRPEPCQEWVREVIRVSSVDFRFLPWADGGFIGVGTQLDGLDLFILVFDACGNLKSERAHHMGGRSARLVHVCAEQSRGIFVAGQTTRRVPYERGVFFSRFDPEGELRMTAEFRSNNTQLQQFTVLPNSDMRAALYALSPLTVGDTTIPAVPVLPPGALPIPGNYALLQLEPDGTARVQEFGKQRPEFTHYPGVFCGGYEDAKGRTLAQVPSYESESGRGFYVVNGTDGQPLFEGSYPEDCEDEPAHLISDRAVLLACRLSMRSGEPDKLGWELHKITWAPEPDTAQP